MTWLTWRLHRFEALLGVALLAGLALVMVVGINSVTEARQAATDGGCFGNFTDPRCGEVLTTYYDRLSEWQGFTTLVHGVPLVAAALLVLPTLQELERGTHRLAWTQSVTRRRWALTRLGFAAAVAAAVAVVWVLRASGWRTSVLEDGGRSFVRNSFELAPAVLIGYLAFAVALAFAAAVTIRRLVPALVVSALGFIAVRVLTSFALRERYMAPVEEQGSVTALYQPFSVFSDRWVVDESWLNGAGERTSWETVNRLCPMDGDKSEAEMMAAFERCLSGNGLIYYRAYHPLDRFGEFQAIETAIFLGLAAGLFALAYWFLTRRPA